MDDGAFGFPLGQWLNSVPTRDAKKPAFVYPGITLEDI